MFFLSLLQHVAPACVFGGSVVLFELRGLVMAFRESDKKFAVLGGRCWNGAVSRTQHEVALLAEHLECLRGLYGVSACINTRTYKLL